MLYSQIQPHFIYNTMNMISMLVELDRGEAAVKNIQRLSLLLRSMSKSNTMHPLADEVQLLRAYLGSRPAATVSGWPVKSCCRPGWNNAPCPP